MTIEKSAAADSTEWVYHPARPAFLPSCFAILMHPDGHIARIIHSRTDLT
jgi:hypothetical protein